MALPTFVAAGAEASAISAITPALPAGIATDDILLLCLATSNQAISVADSAGGTWTEVTDSPQGTGAAGGATSTRLTVFWSRYNGTQTAPTTSDSGDVNEGCIVAFRGCETSGDPWNVTSGGVDAVSETGIEIAGDTTTVDDCLIVALVADSINDADDRYSGWTNADLVNVTERFDNGTTFGADVGLGIATGEKASAGAYGDTTVTISATSPNAFMTIALKPPAGGAAAIVHRLMLMGVGL